MSETSRRILAALVRIAAADGSGAPVPTVGTDGVKFDTAIAWHRRRDRIVTKDVFRQLDTASRQRAFTVAGVTQLDVIVDVHRAIEKAVKDGTTFADFKKEVGPILEKEWAGTVKNPGARLDTIFRTNVQVAYGAGRYQQQQQNLATRPYGRFDGIRDGRQSKICRPLNGIIRRLDDPYVKARTCPLHFRCRSKWTALTEAQARKLGLTTDDKLPRRDDGTLIAAQDGFGEPPETPQAIATGAKANAAQKVAAAPPALVPPATAKIAAPVRVPQGAPVSDALTLPKSGKVAEAVQETLDTIDDLHGDGKLPTIPVKARKLTTHHGHLTIRVSDSAPLEIAVSTETKHPRLTAAHEIGHFIDHDGVTPGQFASTADPRFEDWRKAVDASGAIAKLQKARKTGLLEKTLADGSKGTMFAAPKHVAYLLERHEVWARSYAQWVATRGRLQAMRDELDLSRTNVYPHQWEDADFAPIAKAMDALFEALGWVTVT